MTPPSPDPTPAGGEDELRERLVLILGNVLYSGKSLGQVSKIPKKEFAKWESAIDEIMQLIAQSNQQAVQKARIDELSDAIIECYDHDDPMEIAKELQKRRSQIEVELTAAQPRKDGEA